MIPLSSYGLDCSEATTVKVQSHSKKPVFSLNYFLQLVHTYSTILQLVGGSEFEVAGILASNLRLMRTLKTLYKFKLEIILVLQ